MISDFPNLGWFAAGLSTAMGSTARVEGNLSQVKNVKSDDRPLLQVSNMEAQIHAMQIEELNKLVNFGINFVTLPDFK